MVRKFVSSQLATTLFVLLAFTLLLPAAQASILSVGGVQTPTSIIPGGTLVGSASGTIVTPTLTVPWWEWVYRDPLNTLPGCAGKCLDFVYQFHDNAFAGADAIQRITMSSFEPLGMSAVVNVGMDVLGVHDPLQITWSTDAKVIAFDYTPFGLQIEPGQTTELMVVQTQARTYVPGYVSVQDETSGFDKALSPAAVVPEPASLGLLGGGLIVVGSFVRRKLGL